MAPLVPNAWLKRSDDSPPLAALTLSVRQASGLDQ